MSFLEGFKNKQPKIYRLMYQIFCFWVFSMGVTVLQYLLFTFLPYIFGIKLAGMEFMWPNIPIHFFGFDYNYNILGYEIIKDEMGNIVIGGGLGYFLSYETGTFIAQCVNFPLQRNITFKSKGNIYYQIFWYFIAWMLISLVCNAINGFWIPVAQIYFSHAVYNVLVTFITGGVSMFIYFFVYKIIF